MESNKYKVKHCIQTCSACPSQWDIYTDEGEYIYARYRWGRLTVTLNPWREDSKELCRKDIGDDLDGNLLECIKMPSTPEDVYTALGNYNCEDVVCFIEKVGFGMPGQSSKATATFARHCGQLEMALLAKGISTVEVTPAKWQKHFNLQGKKGESKTSHKNRIKNWSQMRFANAKLGNKPFKVTLWAADALAIASYGFENRK